MKKTVITLASVISALSLLLLPLRDPALFAETSEEKTEGTGQINVSVSPALPLESPVEFTAELSGGMTKILTLNADEENEKEISFKGLAPGDYTLKLSADGFADYTQTISVTRQASSVRLTTDFLKGIAYEQGFAYPGTLLIGDVNNDGVIDGSDKTTLLDSIDSGLNVGDLNGDGKVDLVDLEYLAKGYNTEGTIAVPEIVISSSVIKPSAGEGTEIRGSFEELLTKEGSITLSPENGESISEDNPVSLIFDIDAEGNATDADGIVIGCSEENPVSKATVDIVYTEGGKEYTQIAVIENGVHHLLDTDSVTVEQDSRGNIHINLGDQVAVKKITIKIVGMVKNTDLAEISYVEFVNGMENRIPEPDMDIPENLKGEPGNKSFVLTWDGCRNVTGYEVKIELDGVSDIKKVTGNSINVSSFSEGKLENGTPYTVSVQSVNGAWRSGYCDPITVIPKATSKPGKVDGLNAAGAFNSVKLSWKKAEDAETYNVYYKESGTDEYIKTEGVTGTSYTVSGLKTLTEYFVYVTGVNDIGEGSPSLTVSATTTDRDPAEMPEYFLINTGEAGEKGAHIISASHNYATMKDSPLDTEAKTAWGTVDHDFDSHYYRATWDDGGFNNLGNHGLFYEFDKEYTIQTIAFQEFEPNDLHYSYIKINYWDADGNLTSLGRNQASLSRKTDKNGRFYYLIKLPEKAQIKRIQIGLARYLASGDINISEVYFYNYDTIVDDINALFTDDLHTTLADGVTQETIDALRSRLNTPDKISGELNPDIDALERQLTDAENILNCVGLREAVNVHTSISTYDVGRGFGGLNAWQPLGVTAAAGDSVTVYVGHNFKNTGDLTNLQIVATQYHAESGSVAKTVASLKVGMNVVDIPKLWTVNEESGGALYIQYTGNNAKERCAVRVSGGVSVPKLDLYGVTEEAEKLERTSAYVEELETYVGQMESLHNEHHKGSSNSNVNKFDFAERNCILGASDIMLDTMLMSLPAKQILNGAGTGSTEDKAAKIVDSMKAMEEMMELFYQHKGLNVNAEKELDRFPKQHLNIRYQRMFSGAFMYAAGNHIGIEWNECAGMVNCTPVVADENGRYESGRYFGWGIAHEIGHCINQGAYAVAEVTNNYFAQLAQAKDSNTSVRFKYDKIYEKVTSNTTGSASNVFTQLGMYWQLRSAYDKDYNYKTYDDRTEQLQSLFFARVDSYARDVSIAPAPGGVALTLGGGADQSIMRLACAAAEKNLLEFFERWGKVPDSETVSYASQFEKETRALYYSDDDSRVYRMENPGNGSLGTSGSVQAVGSDTIAVTDSSDPSRVNITLTSENISEEEILGYEIVRCMISGGEQVRETAGFTVKNSFTDIITTVNNRVVFYEITLIDKYLNRSAVKTLEPIKIENDGSFDKTYWSISANDITASEVPPISDGTDDMPCAPKPEDPLTYAIDGKDTVYEGTLGANAEIVLDFNQVLTVSGFKYTAGGENPIEKFIIEVRDESGQWIEAASGSFGGSGTVYFENAEGKYVSTYRADAVKLVLPDSSGSVISAEELDVLGVTGDNIDFLTTADGIPAIGKLAKAYKYGDGENDVIPEGSVIFTGKYKGNPAYNAVLLFDQNGSIVGGVDAEGNLMAQQIILAEVPDNGPIQEVAEGTWIYWIEPNDNISLESILSVRAELYRVNNALTNEGQRLVSDSLFKKMPEKLPDIEF